MKTKKPLMTIKEKLKSALVPEDEQPYPIPENWIWTKLHSIVSINPAKKRIDDVDPDAPVTFVPMAAVDDISGEITTALQRPLMEVKTGYTQFIEGDVIFAKITPCMENGKAAIVKETISRIAYGSTEFYVLRPLGIDASLLYFFVRAQSFRNEAQQVMSGAVGQQRVPKSWLEQHPIPLPPLPEQQRIAAKLESLSGKIKEAKALLDEIPEILQNFRQSVLAAACSGRLTEDWREKNPDVIGATGSVALSGRGTASPLQNDLPETWVASRFDQVFDINPGHKNIPIDNNLNISFVPMNLIEEETGKINTNISKKYKEVKNGYTKFIEDDVLFAKITPCMENGKIAIAQNLINGIGCGTTELHVFRPFIKGMSKYLFYFLLQKTIREQAKRRFQGTSGHMRVPSEFFHDLFFPLPPLEEQTEIVRRVESIFSKADDIESQYKAAMELIEAVPEIILSKAFRGELVPQDPNDEPALGLLERITFEKEKHETEKVEGTKRKKHKQNL